MRFAVRPSVLRICPDLPSKNTPCSRPPFPRPRTFKSFGLRGESLPLCQRCRLMKEGEKENKTQINRPWMHRSLPAFSIRRFEDVVLAVSLEAVELRYGQMANVQLVHSMDATKGRHEKTMFFCDQKCSLCESKGMTFLGLLWKNTD